ncbi:MAG: DUF6236 family protein [Verrucomicrobia bacterium]|nr:DUF6236 family protein [Verrucomicrobiota bacterium]
MKRGVIAQPGVISRHQGSFTLERSISKEEIGYLLLYWDQVVIPGNNLVYIGIPGENDPSVSDVLKRPLINFSGSYSGDMVTDAVLACQSIVAQNLFKDVDTDWSIHQYGDEFILPPDSSSKRDYLKASICSALPAPHEDVSYNEILEFKEKRMDELGRLHNLVDELYIDVLKSPDEDLAAKKVFLN